MKVLAVSLLVFVSTISLNAGELNSPARVNVDMGEKCIAELSLTHQVLIATVEPNDLTERICVEKDGTIKFGIIEKGKIIEQKTLGKLSALAKNLQHTINNNELTAAREIERHLVRLSFPWQPKYSDIPPPCMEPALHLKLRMKNGTPTLAAFLYDCPSVDHWFNPALTQVQGSNQGPQNAYSDDGYHVRQAIELLLRLRTLEKRHYVK